MALLIAVLAAEPAAATGKPLAYVALPWTIAIIDTGSNTVAATIPLADCNDVFGSSATNLGCGPGQIAIAPDGTRGYLTLAYPADSVGAVEVFDTRTRRVTRRIPVCNHPAHLALTPDGSRAYVSCRNDGSISVIDTEAGAVIATLVLGDRFLGGVASNPDGRHIYLANGDASGISIIDTATNSQGGLIDIGIDPHSGRIPAELAVTPDGRRLYIVNDGSGAISVAETAGNTIVGSITAPTRNSLPSPIAINPGGTKAYNVNAIPRHLQEIDLATNTMRDTGLCLEPGISSIAISPDGRQAYLVSSQRNAVRVVDLRTYTVRATIQLWDQAGSIAVALPPAGPIAPTTAGAAHAITLN